MSGQPKRDDLAWTREFEKAGCIFGSSVERVERPERRFLVEPDPAVGALGLPAGLSVESYTVETTYFLSPTHGIVRLRRYLGSGGMWLERKSRDDDRVVKTRIKVIEFTQPLAVHVVAGVTYERVAYEDESMRITVDRTLRSGDRGFAGSVVEIKGSGIAEVEANLPREAAGFSKYRWATSAFRAEQEPRRRAGSTARPQARSRG